AFEMPAIDVQHPAQADEVRSVTAADREARRARAHLWRRSGRRGLRFFLQFELSFEHLDALFGLIQPLQERGGVDGWGGRCLRESHAGGHEGRGEAGQTRTKTHEVSLESP